MIAYCFTQCSNGCSLGNFPLSPSSMSRGVKEKSFTNSIPITECDDHEFLKTKFKHRKNSNKRAMIDDMNQKNFTPWLPSTEITSAFFWCSSDFSARNINSWSIPWNSTTQRGVKKIWKRKFSWNFFWIITAPSSDWPLISSWNVHTVFDMPLSIAWKTQKRKTWAWYLTLFFEYRRSFYSTPKAKFI